jgi:hypothetical protein
MLARKKRAKIAREKKRQELLLHPPRKIVVVPLREIKQRLEANKAPILPRYEHRSSNEIITRPETMTCNTGRSERLFYTGSRLLGIAVLHKSCLQPVFSQEEAVNAATMRRN